MVPLLRLPLWDEADITGKFVLLMIAFGIISVFMFYTYRRLRLHFAMTKWRRAEATICGGFGYDLRDDDDDAGKEHFFGWNPGLQYSYQVAGEHHSGYFLLDHVFYSPEYARDATQEWIKRRIFIRYNPANPEESAFLEEDGAPPDSRSMSMDGPPSNLVTLFRK